jgi:hypothetical protein
MACNPRPRNTHHQGNNRHTDQDGNGATPANARRGASASAWQSDSTFRHKCNLRPRPRTSAD